MNKIGKIVILISLPVHQNDEDVTELELLELFGSPVATTNMKELKKKGESVHFSFSGGNYFFRMRIIPSTS